MAKSTDAVTISNQLIDVIRKQYLLPWNGVHGIGHWARVRENGIYIASKLADVNARVVELFAIFHDAARINEGTDLGHGCRGGELARALRGKHFEATDQEFEQLYEACLYHTDGRTDAEITVQACWDADRLDLGRVGLVPDLRFLCTSVAKDSDVIAWALQRAQKRVFPQFAIEEWFVDLDSG